MGIFLCVHSRQIDLVSAPVHPEIDSEHLIVRDYAILQQSTNCHVDSVGCWRGKWAWTPFNSLTWRTNRKKNANVAHTSMIYGYSIFYSRFTATKREYRARWEKQNFETMVKHTHADWRHKMMSRLFVWRGDACLWVVWSDECVKQTAGTKAVWPIRAITVGCSYSATETTKSHTKGMWNVDGVHEVLRCVYSCCGTTTTHTHTYTAALGFPFALMCARSLVFA